MSESVSEFFDAQEVLLSASSSENEVRFPGVSIHFVCLGLRVWVKTVRLWDVRLLDVFVYVTERCSPYSRAKVCKPP